MRNLIERLEKATGPDRELDAQIAIAIEAIPSDAFRPCAAIDVGTFGVGGYGFWTAPTYTALIDSALTLLPDLDHDWKAGYSTHVPHNAEVHDLMHPYKGVFIGEHDHSRAIALCIAALRARESLCQSDEPHPQKSEKR